MGIDGVFLYILLAVLIILRKVRVQKLAGFFALSRSCSKPIFFLELLILSKKK